MCSRALHGDLREPDLGDAVGAAARLRLRVDVGGQALALRKDRKAAGRGIALQLAFDGRRDAASQNDLGPARRSRTDRG